MTNVTQVSQGFGKPPVYRDELGNEYTQDYIYENYTKFQDTNRTRDNFVASAKRHNAKGSRLTARANFGGKFRADDIVKEILTDTLVGAQR